MRVSFPISEDLRQEVESAMIGLRRAEEPEEHAERLAEAVTELIDAGLDYYFIRPLRRAQAGLVTLNGARLAVASANRTLPALVRHVLGGLSGEQLLVIVDYLDGILIEEDRASAATGGEER
jgi:hypothetical protein